MEIKRRGEREPFFSSSELYLQRNLSRSLFFYLAHRSIILQPSPHAQSYILPIDITVTRASCRFRLRSQLYFEIDASYLSFGKSRYYACYVATGECNLPSIDAARRERQSVVLSRRRTQLKSFISIYICISGCHYPIILKDRASGSKPSDLQICKYETYHRSAS